MSIRKSIENGKCKFSFEFFPPRTEDASRRLFESVGRLAPLKPAYVSVTYGAGGTTRQLTQDLLLQIKRKTDIPVVSHLTCVGGNSQDIYDLLASYNESGINSILALRGDPPQGASEFRAPPNGFQHASELVAFIRENFPDMTIGVAGYPEGHGETPNRLKEIEYLKRKVDAGADYICTQLFFDNHEFYDFRERCEYAGIEVPIIAGIMPVTTRKGLYRMADLAAGTRIPARLLKDVESAKSKRDVEQIGVDWGASQVADLIEHGVAGVHFFTLNKYPATLRIHQALLSNL